MSTPSATATCAPAHCDEQGYAWGQDELVCRCLKLTAAEVVEAIVVEQLQTVKELGRCTGAGQGCTVCHVRLRALLAQHST